MSVSFSEKQKTLNRKFDEVLLKVLDDSLTRIGKSVGPVVYYNLEKDLVKKKDIPAKTECFSACLKMIFGEGVAYLIEMSIVKKLYLEIDEKLEKREEYSFTNYVDNAREKYLKKGVKQAKK